MKITSNFDSGNIKVIQLDDPSDIKVEINKDNQSDFYQWFHFRLQTNAMVEHKIHITNAGGAAYLEGWDNYQAVASYDRETWFRVDTQYDGQVLTIDHVPEYDSVYYAYFAPYSYERHMDLIHQCQLSFDCQIVDLGETLDGRDMTMLVIGEPEEGKKKVWITARQHPGETMAEWFMEGMLSRLLDEEDGCAKALLDKTVFYVVPNMNPDGSYRGHLRTNAVGANLNREWQEPTMERSPEVYLVREKMMEIGLDLHLDVHGDEALPYNFVAGAEGVPNYNDHIASLEKVFKDTYLITTPDFQDVKGYPKDEPGKADLTIATNWIANHFKTMSFTIEMPFKDNIELPDPAYGWSDARSAKFGHDVLPAVLATVNHLNFVANDTIYAWARLGVASTVNFFSDVCLMAIVTCPNCNAKMSSKARNCPSCGAGADMDDDERERLVRNSNYKKLQQISLHNMVAVVIAMAAFYMMYFQFPDRETMQFKLSLGALVIGFTWYVINRVRHFLIKSAMKKR